MRQITNYNINSCSTSKCYILIDGDAVLYKLQAIDNIQSVDKENCNFAFCCLDDSVYYGYGIIDKFYSAITKILKFKNIHLIELNNMNEIMDYLAQKRFYNDVEISDIEKIKWNVSVKRGSDIGYALATLLYIAGHTPESTSNH